MQFLNDAIRMSLKTNYSKKKVATKKVYALAKFFLHTICYNQQSVDRKLLGGLAQINLENNINSTFHLEC